jgi:hypothetical protein
VWSSSSAICRQPATELSIRVCQFAGRFGFWAGSGATLSVFMPDGFAGITNFFFFDAYQ